jgi:hypothetical protein
VFLFLPFCGNFFLFFLFFFGLWGREWGWEFSAPSTFMLLENLGHVSSPFIMEMKPIGPLGHIIRKWKFWLLGHTHQKNTTYTHTHTHTHIPWHQMKLWLVTWSPCTWKWPKWFSDTYLLTLWNIINLYVCMYVCTRRWSRCLCNFIIT